MTQLWPSQVQFGSLLRSAGFGGAAVVPPVPVPPPVPLEPPLPLDPLLPLPLEPPLPVAPPAPLTGSHFMVCFPFCFRMLQPARFFTESPMDLVILASASLSLLTSEICDICVCIFICCSATRWMSAIIALLMCESAATAWP